MPGACAPSTSVSTPRSRSSRTIRAIGRTSPVELVTWSSRARRVLDVTRSSTAATTFSPPSMGNGSSTTETLAPTRRATNSMTLRHALYSWSVTNSSSPAVSSSERSTALTPVVAFVTKASPAGSAPRNRASSRRAASNRSRYS